LSKIRGLLAKVPGLRAVYHWSSYYKAKTAKLEQQLADRDRASKELHDRLFSVAFQDDLTVRYGPFAGMRYLKESSGSQVLPKVLGSYEEPLHCWLEEILTEKTYDLILDVGCAEGYYAVGFAWRLPSLRVRAFDINPEARKQTRALAILNHVQDRVSIETECDFQQFEKYGGSKTLVFCDIEGAEDGLLDPVQAPRLKECDILVEAHDFLVDGITDRLLLRFAPSHRIRIAVDYPGRLKNYDFDGWKELSAEDCAALIDEVRPPQMRFLYLEPLLKLKREMTSADTSS